MSQQEMARSAAYIVTHDHECASVTAADGWRQELGEFYATRQQP